MTLGAVVITRNDGYGGDQPRKLLYCLHSLLAAMDEVILVDWNSPDYAPALDRIRHELPVTGRLRHIVIKPSLAAELAASAMRAEHPLPQACCEVLARNIGLRRLNADFLVSTNHDLITLARPDVATLDRGTFHCIARREVHLDDVKRVFAHAPLSADLWRFLTDHSRYLQGHHTDSRGMVTNFGQHAEGSPLGPQDPWSLITCPGDFQLAHRDVWRAIRGFEEEFVGRGYNDSNVQRKAVDAGCPLRLVRDIAVFHLAHYPDTGSSGGAFGEWNDAQRALFNFAGTTNGPAWGFADRTFPEETL